MTTLVMAGILIFGVMAYRLLPVSDLPNVDFPTIQVSAALPGASPETMASSVATPLERQFSTIAGPRQHELHLDAGLDPDHAAVQPLAQPRRRRAGRAVGDRGRRRGSCRRTCRAPPSYEKVNPADQPVLYLALTSKTLPLLAARRVRRDHDGAAHLDGRGRRAGAGLRPAEVRRARPARPAAARQPRHRHRRGRRRRAQRQRQPADRDPVRAADRRSPSRPTGRSSTRRATGRSSSRTATARRSASATSADVVDGVENDKTAAWYNDERSISLAIFKQPGTNTVAGRRGGPQAAADVPEAAAGVGLAPRPLRPLGVDPRLGQRRASSRCC